MKVVAAQTHAHSMAETVTSTAIGFAINFAAQVLLFPLFGIYVHLATNLAISGAFTVISVARGYLLRRFFQWRQGRALAHSCA